MTPTPARVAARVGLVAVRARPGRASEQTTEVLCGEPLTVLERVLSGEDPWLRVRGMDAYEGWVPEGPVAEVPPEWPGPAAVRVIERAATVIGPLTGSPVGILPHGALLWVTEHTPDALRVQLPGGQPGVIEAAATESVDCPIEDRHAHLRETMAVFMGVPYRWGGRSPWGVDCSGLVQRLAASLGVMLPRDAHQQEAWLARRELRLERSEVTAGTVLFWGVGERATHTALALDHNRFLHARDWVRVGEWSSGPDADLAPRFRGGYRLPEGPETG